MDLKKKPTKKDNFVFLFKGSPLNDFLYPFKKAANQWVARYIIVTFAIIIRCAVGLGSYSGENQPPNFGDFEYNRHYMEIVTSLPLYHWYLHDLGNSNFMLKFPPLYAYHSFIWGIIGKLINKSWFELNNSIGCQDIDLKSFMRITVLFSELIAYIPSVIIYTRWMGRHYNKAPSIDQTIIAATILFLPDLAIIDHGHFQYNSLLLGIALIALNNLLYDNLALASIFFTLSICFNPMILYYSPIFFFYLLSLCFVPKFNLIRLIYIGVSVLLTFIVIFLPFIYSGGIQLLSHILYTTFPLNFNILHQSYPNFWSMTNHLLNNNIELSNLKNLSIILTILAISPSCYAIFTNTSKRLLPWCLASCSLSFFLFSFLIDETSVLLPWMPVTLLLNEVDADVISMICWFFNTCLFSLMPLLKKDGLLLQYFVLGVLSNWLMGNLSWVRKFVNIIIPFISQRPNATPVLPHSYSWTATIIFFYVTATIILLCDLLQIQPLVEIENFWEISNTFLSTISFGIFYVWLNFKIYTIHSLKAKSD